MIELKPHRGIATRVLLALPLLWLLSSPGHAADWNYRVRPGDNVWNLSSRYLKPTVGWQKLQDYNKVADPLHLPPGMVIHVPVAWLRLEPAHATVVAVIGHAHAKADPQANEIDVQPGMSFGYGAQIRTETATSLTLEFADKSRVLVQANSELDLDRLSAYGDTGMVDTRLRLQRGRVATEVTPLTGTPAHFSITTPGSISSVRGTHFRVAADDTSAQTEVTKGRVDVAGGKRHVLVQTDTGVNVADGAAPGKAVALLAAPELACPSQPVTRIAYALRWNPVPSAAHYRIQVAPSARFEALLEDRVIEAPQASLPDLPDGEHALRVRAIDANKLEGQDTDCVFTVAAHPQPPLAIEPQPGGKARDPRPTFRWTESDEAASYAWQLSDDEAFTHVLSENAQIKGSKVRAPQELPLGHYFWRIATRDQHGKLGPYSDPLPFDRVQDLPAPSVDKPKASGHDLNFAWSAGLPGQRFHLQLAQDNQFTHPLIDQTVDQPTLQIKKPGSGVWYLHVQTVDTDGYLGPWGPTQKIKLPCYACRIAAGGGAVVVLWLLL